MIWTTWDASTSGFSILSLWTVLAPEAREKLKLWGRGPLVFQPPSPGGGSKGRPLSHDE